MSETDESAADDFWWVHTIDVRPRTGHDGVKPIYGETLHDLPCWLVDEIKTVRDAAGNETTSTATVHLALSDARRIPAESWVDTGTREAFVISTELHDSGSLGWHDLDHGVLHLT